MKQKYVLLLVAFMMAVLMTSCAPGNEMFYEDSAGFLMGFWHGVISLVTLIIGIFDHTVKMYEVNNTGWMYDLGFLLGVGFGFSNIWFTGSKAKKNK